MRLVDLHPKWWAEPDRVGQGISFDCPCGCAGKPNEARLSVAFANPLDGGVAIALGSPRLLWPVIGEGTRVVVPPGIHWTRSGETFESLTLSPSIHAGNSGHWHGHVVSGGIVP